MSKEEVKKAEVAEEAKAEENKEAEGQGVYHVYCPKCGWTGYYHDYACYCPKFGCTGWLKRL